MPNIQTNIKMVLQRIEQAASACSRDASEIRLLAVSKTFPAEQVRQAYQAGLHRFGENYVNEALEKIQELAGLDIEWHFIGPMQSNKTRHVAEYFDWVQGVSSEKIAARLSRQRPEALPPLNVCIQVNISQEENKSGLLPDQTLSLANFIIDLPQLKLRGIMGIPEKTSNPEKQLQAFNKLAAIYRQMQISGIDMDTLSMGMTGDMEAAINAGSTMIRIGTAVFGKRKNNNME